MGAMRVVSVVLIMFAVVQCAPADEGVIWFEDFNGGTPGQSVLAEPYEWKVLHGSNDTNRCATFNIFLASGLHADWTGLALKGDSSTGGCQVGPPDRSNGQVQKSIAGLVPSHGIVTLSAKMWADGPQAYGYFGWSNMAGSWMHLAYSSTQDAWYIDVRGYSNDGAVEYASAGVGVRKTVLGKLYADLDDLQAWAELIDVATGTTIWTSGKFAIYAAKLPLGVVRVYQDRTGTDGGLDIDDIHVDSSGSGVVWSENFDAGTEGQSILDAPFQWNVWGSLDPDCYATFDVSLAEELHPGWTGLAVQGSSSVSGCGHPLEGGQTAHGAGYISKDLSTIVPRNGTVTSSARIWVDGLQSIAEMGWLNAAGSWAALGYGTESHLWWFTSIGYGYTGPTSYSPQGVGVDMTVIAKICADLDTFVMWAELIDDATRTLIWTSQKQAIDPAKLPLELLFFYQSRIESTPWGAQAGIDIDDVTVAVNLIEADLPLDTPTPVNLTPALPAAMCRLRAPEGSPVIIEADCVDDRNANTLSLCWAEPPRTGRYDLVAHAANQAHQTMIVPRFRALPAYILLRGDFFNGGVNRVNVLARIVPLGLVRMTSTYASDTRKLSTAIAGTGFRTDTAFVLRHKDTSNEVASSAVQFVSIDRMEAEFALAGALLGAYDLVAHNPDGPPAVLSDVFEVVATRRGAVLHAALTAPDYYRSGRLGRIKVVYGNTGDEEMSSPLFKVVGPSGTGLWIEGQPETHENVLQVIGIDPQGVPGTLAPGRSGEIPVLFRCTDDNEAHFQLYRFAPNDGDFVGWDKLSPPPGLESEAWVNLWPPLSGRVGATWKAYGEYLALVATRLAHRRGPAAMADAVFRLAAREALGRPSAAIVGQVRDAATGTPCAGTTVVALQGGQVRASTVSDEKGYYVLDWLLGGQTYALGVADFAVPSPQVALPVGNDVLGHDLALTAQENDLAAACPNCDEQGLPSKALMPPDVLFAPVGALRMSEIGAIDPNAKVGPSGEGGDVRAGALLRYTIFFENIREGTNAQRIEILDQLRSWADPTSFTPGHVTFGNDERFSASFDALTPGDSTSKSQTWRVGHEYAPPFLDIDGKSWHVVASCDYNPTTGLAKWTLEMVNEQKNVPGLDDVEVGFLPYNDRLDDDVRKGEGEGHVTFTVQSLPSLAEGTVIENDAKITFDYDLDKAQTTYPPTSNTIRYPLPGKPYSPSPADDETRAIDIPPKLTWEQPAADGTTYDVYFWREGQTRPGSPDPAGVDLTGPLFKPAEALTYATTYHWQVDAKNNKGVTQGPEWSFVILSDRPPPPAKPSEPSPFDGKTDVSLDPLLTWKGADGAPAYYTLKLWRQGNELSPVEAPAGLSSSQYQVLKPLETNTRYEWQVTAENTGGKTEGPVWSFTTRRPPGQFKRGDCNGDNSVNIADAISLLSHLFAYAAAPSCEDSADANDDGALNIADAIKILGHLFAQAGALPAPFDECGADPTEDTLECASFPPCL